MDVHIKVKGGVLKFNSTCCYDQSDFRPNSNDIWDYSKSIPMDISLKMVLNEASNNTPLP